MNDYIIGIILGLAVGSLVTYLVIDHINSRNYDYVTTYYIDDGDGNIRQIDEDEYLEIMRETVQNAKDNLKEGSDDSCQQW